MRLYVEDATVIENYEAPIRGRAAIRQRLYPYRGNYITIWVLRSGTWRILYDMDASAPGSRVTCGS